MQVVRVKTVPENSEVRPKMLNSRTLEMALGSFVDEQDGLGVERQGSSHGWLVKDFSQASRT